LSSHSLHQENTLGKRAQLGHTSRPFEQAARMSEFITSGAVNIPLADFSATHKSVKSALDKPVVVYDRTGMKSDSAAAQLVAAGFKQVGSLSGGLDAWLRDSLPTAKGK